MFLSWDAEGCGGFVYGCRQFRQWGCRFDPDPKDSGRLRRGEKAAAAEGDLEWFCVDSGKRLFDLIDSFS